MSVLLWITAILGALVLLVMVIVLAALTSLIRIEGRLVGGGSRAHGRWGLLGFEVHPAEDRMTLEVLGVRVMRTKLSQRAATTEAPESRRVRGVQETWRERRADVHLSLASYRRLARTGWQELRHMLRHLHVDRLRLDAVVASPDPVRTGEIYGLGCAANSLMRGLWPHADVRLDADFLATEPRAAGELALRLRPIRLVPGVLRVGSTYWRERRASRRRA